jgi:hypothetical protein
VLFLFYAFCSIPFVMLAIVCFAILGKVREGRYEMGLYGPLPPMAPKPRVAVAMVTSPFYAVIYMGW